MLQPTGLAVLDRLGLGERARAQGARIDRLFGQSAPSGRTVLDVGYRALRTPGLYGVGIHRATLFALLFEAVMEAGIAVETGRTIAGSTTGAKGRRCLIFENGTQAGPFDLVVDALGSRTPLAPPTGRTLDYGALWASLDWPADTGFDPHALEQRYRAASTMVGVLPTGAGAGSAHQAAFFWSLRGDAFTAWQATGLDAWKAQVMSLWPACAPLLDQIDTPARLTFARYAHRTLARPAEPALIHIGDAWHSASPQLGQGANMALLDAWAVAQGLREAGSNVDAAIVRAVALRRRHIVLYQTLSSLFTPVYQSDSRVLPFVRDTVVGPVSKLWPATSIQAAMVSGLVGNPLAALGLD
jgi:2-polyprenyl-6-methoxyphenol hydroxylase-like FAD-dependent oxidoreductase